MSKLNYIKKTFLTLKNSKAKGSNPPPKNELIDPRFGIAETDIKTEKVENNSLLFLMYSKENEALFI
jgi:hypothetical protein